MGLLGQANLDIVNRTVETVINKAFSDRPPGHFGKFTYSFSAPGTEVRLPVVGGLPALREFLGARQVGGLRTHIQTIALRKWELTIGLPLEYIRGDITGVLGERVGDLMTQAQFVHDKIMFDNGLLDAALTGYDGEPLLDAAHPFVGTGGTADNDVGGALGYANYRVAEQMLQEMFDEAGEPLNVVPTHLVVGTAQSEIAMQVSGSDKIVGISDAGELVAAGGSGIDGTSQLLPNYVGGRVLVAVSPRLTGNQWFLMDCSKGSRKPMLLAEFSKPEVVVKDDPKDDNVFFDREVLIGLHFDATPAVGDWHLVAGDI